VSARIPRRLSRRFTVYYGTATCASWPSFGVLISVHTIKFADAQVAAQSIHQLAPASPASEAYRELAREVAGV
jgi:hypothetical protein